MIEGWISTTIGEQATLQRGFDITRATQRNGTIPVYSSSGLSSYHDEAMVNGPGVVLGRKGVVGSVFFVGESYWPHDTTLWVKDFHGNDRRFVYYFFRSIAPSLASLDVGSANPTLNRNHVHPIRIFWPADVSEQEAISSLLGSLDDKIELNRRMNETLEAMARAIFRDWFIDFGPTRAKMDGREPYLTPDIWSLFPDRLDDEGKPEGWVTAPLSNLVQFNPSEQLIRGAEAPYLDMAALPTSGPNAEPWRLREFSSGTRFRNGDTLLARITPCLENGKTALVHGLPNGPIGWGSTEFIVMRARAPVSRAVPYLIARDPAFRAHAIRSMTGTSGRQRASTEAIEAYRVAEPDTAEIWVRFAEVTDPLFERIAVNDRESQTLAATRDLLLPKLMSGEIRSKDAEKLSSEAA